MVVETASALGLPGLVLGSGWRKRRLLILCYHGVSLDDEHQWRPGLYMAREQFRERMQALRDLGCAVLPLGESLERLRRNDLPARSVALTFDDGVSDFSRVAMPVLREFGYPVTLYWTTYYSTIGLPVFNVMLPYVLWKARERQMEWPQVLPGTVELNAAGREWVRGAVLRWCDRMSAEERDQVLEELGSRAGVDYPELRARRILSLITPEEAASLAREGVDLELHTHRHQVWRDPDKMAEEIRLNREMIVDAGGRDPRHFCYPSGSYTREVVDALRGAGILSATTCVPGLAASGSPAHELPRMLDSSSMSAAEFEAWVSGWAPLFARRGAVKLDAVADAPAGGA